MTKGEADLSMDSGFSTAGFVIPREADLSRRAVEGSAVRFSGEDRFR
jgi:hypothetical protein